MEDDPSTTGEEDRATLVSLCCEAKVAELRGKLALRQFKQLLCAPLKYRDFQNKETILHSYSYEELEVVNELLDQGADACINSGPVTPLSYACQRNHKELVRLLLKHGANPEPALSYADNPEILQMLRKKQHETRRAAKSKNETSNSDDKKQQDPEKDKVSSAISKHISSLFSSSDGLAPADISIISEKLAKATSFSDIASSFQLLYEHCKPEGEKAVGEFVAALLLLPFGLPTFSRYIVIDHHGQANRIAEALFSRLPAYRIAVFVESRLARFEKDRPRSSFPHLYVTLVHTIADTIITSLIGSTQFTSDDMVAPTTKLLKWISAVGFLNNSAESSSMLKNRLMSKSLLFATRHLCNRSEPRETPDTQPSPILINDSSPPYPPYSSSPNVVSPPINISTIPNSPELFADDNLFVSSPNPTSNPSTELLPNMSAYPTTMSAHSSTPSLPLTPPQYSSPRSTTPPRSSPQPLQYTFRPSTPPTITISASSPITVPPLPLSPAPAIHSTAFLITVKIEHPPTGGFNLKVYNTTALSVLHDKISARLLSRIAAPGIRNELKEESMKKLREEIGDFVFVCPDGRRIEVNEPGVIEELAHPGNSITLSVL